MSRQRNAGQNHSLHIAIKFFENVAKVMSLGKIVTNQNYIHEEIKSTLNSGNASGYSVQGLLSSRLLSNNLKD
jgi:hypothetical protein